MIPGQDQLYFIFDENNNFYFRDEFRQIGTSTTPRPVQFSPDGWQEISIITSFNFNYWGFDREFTIPLGWVEDGADIIKHVQYTQGYEAKLFIAILEQKLSLGGGKYSYYYDALYRGELDLSTFEHTGAKVTVNSIDGGLAAMLKANENTVYNIPVGNKNVLMDGLNYHQAATFNVLSVTVGGSTALGQHYVPMAFIGDESIMGLSFFSQSPQPVSVAAESFAMNETPTFVLMKLQGFINLAFSNHVTAANVRLRFKDSGGAVTTLKVWTIAAPTSNLVYTLTVDENVNFSAGAELYLETLITALPAQIANAQTYYKESELKAVYNYRKEVTYIKGSSPHEVYAELVRQATDGKFYWASQFLQELQDVRIVHTCGDAVRGIAGAKIKTSLKEFYNSYNVRWNIGMGQFAGQLLIEPKEFWITAGTEIDLGEVSALKVTSAANELGFSKLLIGYPPEETNNLNGKQEPNTTLSMQPPTVRVPKDLTLVSDYRTDATGIEEIRINLQGKKTTDDSGDNDNILLHCTKNPVSYFTADNAPIYGLNRTLNAGATGLIDPESFFNLYFSPGRCFEAWSWYLHSVMPPGVEAMKFKFTNLDKNQELQAGGIVEKADRPVSTLQPRKFTMDYFEFETRVPEGYLASITQNPVKTFVFTYKGLILRGIGIETGIEPSINKAMTFKLLSLAGNDIEKLKKISD